MSFDTWLAAVACVCQLAMTVVATWWALRPPKREQHWYIISVFALVGGLGLGAIVWSGIRASQELKNQQANVGAAFSGLHTDISGLKQAVAQRPPVVVQMPPQLVPPAPPAPPRVALTFLYPKSPVLRILNVSGTTAKEIKYAVVVWDIDKPEERNPLQIPTQSFDFIRPHLSSGNMSMFDQMVGSGVVKNGTRLFGSANVACAECPEGRTYWLYIEWGKGGWFSRIPGVTSGGFMVPKDFSKITTTQFANEVIASIPEAKRVPIKDPPE